MPQAQNMKFTTVAWAAAPVYNSCDFDKVKTALLCSSLSFWDKLIAI
jgi:hypothetical protein